MQKGKTMIDELMEKLLEEPVVDNNEIVFTSRAVELIHEISEKCKGIQIVEQTREQAEEYAKDLSAEEVYYDMLRKIVDAPTALHMKCSVRMLVPIIDRKLKESYFSTFFHLFSHHFPTFFHLFLHHFTTFPHIFPKIHPQASLIKRSKIIAILP